MLGYKVRFNRILPSDRIYHNIMWYLKRTTRRFAHKGLSKVLPYAEKVMSTVNSYLGMLRHMSAYRLRRRICEIVADSVLGLVMLVSPDYLKVTIRPQYKRANHYLTECKQLKHRII